MTVRKSIIHISKKALFFIIAAAFCFSAIPSVYAVTSVVGRTEENMSLIYAYSEYSISLRNASYLSGASDDGKRLTDTKYSTVEVEDGIADYNGWTVIKSYDGKTDFRATVNINLGFTAKDISLFFLRAYKNLEVGADMPNSIKFYVSEDGSSYKSVGTASTTTDISGSSASAVYQLSTSEGYTARYIRAVIECTGGTHLALNEVGAAASGRIFRSNSDTTTSFTDRQGVIYSIKNGVAEVIGATTAYSGRKGQITPSDASFDTDGITYTLGAGSSNPVKVTSDFISSDKVNYSGIPNNIKYIVIHNTGTTEDSTNAERYNHRMHNMTEEKSWHYTVDSEEIYHSLTDSIVGWHSGSSHNYESIGIEICTNGAPTRSSGAFIFSGTAYDEWVKTTFRPALKNAAMLTAELLTRYSLGTDAVIQHYDVTEKNCPLWLRYKDGKYVHDGTLWLEFMEYVEQYYYLLNGSSPIPSVQPSNYITLPDYVSVCGDFYPLVKIGSNAFVGKGSSLKSIYVSKNISEIDPSAFGGCEQATITVSPQNTDFSASNGILYDSAGKTVFNRAKAYGNAPKANSGLDIRESDGKYYLFCDSDGYTLSQLAQKYGAIKYSATSLSKTILSANSKLGTGTLVNFDGSCIYIVIKGDLNGDGMINVFDCTTFKSIYYGNYKPNGSQYYSALITGQTSITPFDYVRLKAHVLGTFDIFE